MTHHPNQRRPRVTRDEAIEAAARAWLAAESASDGAVTPDMEESVNAASEDSSAPAETFARFEFMPGVEVLTLDWPGGDRTTTLVMECDRDLSPDDIRGIAESFESFPGWLRGIANAREDIE